MLPCPFCKEPWHSLGQWLTPATIKQQPINVGLEKPRCHSQNINIIMNVAKKVH